MSEVGRMKVRRIPMGVDLGGTSWISLRSVHFLEEVYIKPKKKRKKKNPVSKSSKACQHCSDEDMPK